MRKLTYLKGVLIGSLLVNLLNSSVYGLVEVKSDINFTEDTDIAILIEGITEELDKLPNIESLDFSFNYKLNEGTDRYSYISQLQTRVNERLDGVSTITPSLRTSTNTGTITFKLRKYIPTSEEYNNALDELVNKAKLLDTDIEKVRLFGNYLYKNGFSYNYDGIGTSRSSTTVDNPNCMPDGVFTTKKGICLGFTNLASDYFTRLGIPCVKLRGHDVEDGGYHIWNMLYLNLDGEYKWYCVDVLYSLWGIDRKELIKTQDEYAKEMNWDKSLLEDIIRIKYSDKDLENYRNRNYFTDMRNNWAEKSVYALFNRGFVSGFPDRTYRPYNTISIAEFLCIAINSSKPEEETYSNVNEWWDGAYYYALNKGIINEELFPVDGVKNNITREEMAYILVKIDEIMNNNEPLEEPEDFSIVDMELISPEFKDIVVQSYLKGFICGVDEKGTFNPLANANRAQTAAIICRVLGVE